jgi:hypothetical protein
MRILAIQSKGLNPENVEFKEGLQRALIRLGHEVDTYGPGHPLFETPFPVLYRDRKWDVVLLMEDYDRNRWVPNVYGLKCYRVLWSMDSHLAMQAHKAVSRRQRVDLVLTAVHDSVGEFQSTHTDAVWFPNAYPSDLIGPRDVDREHPLGHCGSWANRRGWIHALDQQVGIKKDIGVIGDSMVRAINSYYIHWNRNISHDLNCRTFETTGCGTFLLTNETPGLRQCFEVGTHLDTYETVDDCVEKVKYYMSHPDERDSIAAAGLKHAQEHHTYDVRARQLLEMLERRV